MESGFWTLTEAATGDLMRVRAIRGANGLTQRLRELGVLEGRSLQVISSNHALICRVGDCRFGMPRRLADCVELEPLTD
jgi:Fe2+ transport system protein FeoA